MKSAGICPGGNVATPAAPSHDSVMVYVVGVSDHVAPSVHSWLYTVS